MAQRDVSLDRDRARAAEAHVKARAPGFESAESALAREQAEADARTPDWDLASRITTAQGALERGVPAEIVRKTYGERVFAAATARLNLHELAHAAG
jgi:hypothetical protein